MPIADWFVKYWVLLAAAAVFIASAAVGEWRVQTLEEAAKAQQTQAKELQRIEVHQATITTKQEAIADDVRENKDALKANQALLIQILQKVQ